MSDEYGVLPDGLNIQNILTRSRARRPPSRYAPDPDTEFIDEYSCSSEDDLDIEYTDDDWVKEEEGEDGEEEEDEESYIPDEEEDEEYIPDVYEDEEDESETE